MNTTIHPSSVVDPRARIGAYTSIWHFCHVEPGAIIGENNNLGQNVYVGNDAIIGNACRIGNSVSIFSHVQLDDFVFCAPFMVFTHIAFPRACVSRRGAFVRTRIRTGATLGANATVVPGVEVGRGAFLAAGSTLTKSCKEWALMMGSPARHVGWVSAYGEKIPFQLTGSGSWTCPHTGDRYAQEGEVVRREPGSNDILQYFPGRKLDRIVAVG
jgi:UDP-2-acetamido-3-amino-2,3-dideoxy-glucuronate N-acetyltransferase